MQRNLVCVTQSSTSLTLRLIHQQKMICNQTESAQQNHDQCMYTTTFWWFKVMCLPEFSVYADDGDIIVSSCDSVQFKIHRRNLHTHSGIFPGDELSTYNETVYLSEDASTLELLFQYIYGRVNADLSLVDFENLAKLAEAAEKYQVFPAMEACRMLMR